MEKLDPKIEGATTDIIGQNIENLKQLFPDIFTEGKIDFDVLRETLGNYIDDRPERYSFNWSGKARARHIAQTSSTGTLRPCPEESINWDTTQNICIEGDNLEVLKLLQKSYHRRIRIIYIDPPYNTGKDFVYPDHFRDNIRNYLEITGQVDDAGRRLSSNTEASGRFHTDWLNMMYPRLKLARNLLREDGIIFISIDDSEISSLRKLCDEIFGEENFIAQAVWEKMYTTKNDAALMSQCHEYVLIYVRNIEARAIQLLPRTEEMDARYTNPDNDPRGPWKPIPLYAKGERKRGRYAVFSPLTGKEHWPGPDSHWLYIEEDTKKLIDDNRIYFGRDGNAQPNIKRFLTEVQQGKKSKTLWKHKEVGSNDSAKRELRELYGNDKIPFDFPKPTTLLSRMLLLATRKEEDDIALDFFAGSGTTGHAVLAQNAYDGGNRRFILVQLPEKIDPSNKEQKFAADFCDRIGRPRNIAELTKDRLRRAGKKIQEKNSLFKGDIGFKVLKLASSNIKPWDVDFDNLKEALFDAVENIKPDRSEADVLYELLLKYGLDLAVPIEKRELYGKTVYVIGAGALIVCLAKQIGLEVVEGIAALKDELKPEVMRVVFKDSGFKDDVVKTNAVQILHQAGIDDVKSL